MVWTRRSGPLVLDITVGPKRLRLSRDPYLLFILFVAIGSTGYLIVHPSGDKWVLVVCVYAFAMRFFGRQEIRRHGIVNGIRFIRWSRIASWNWEDSKEGLQDNKILVIHLHRRIQFLPPARITVQASQRDQVEGILARQLGEWPG